MVGFGSTAEAGVIEYRKLDGVRVVAWTNSPCSAFESSPELKATCVDDLAAASKAAVGPGGGVLLAAEGNFAFEANPKNGNVYRITTGEDGEVVAKDFVVRLKQPAGKRMRTLVTGRIELVEDASALVDATAKTRRSVLSLRYVVGQGKKEPQSFELRFDARSLKPTSPPDKTIAVYDIPLMYWN